MLAVSMRPIPPEPTECPKIKKAMRAAQFMKWGAVPLAWTAALVAITIGAASRWYVGVGVFLAAWGTLFVAGFSRARCPRCGQVWSTRMGMVTFAPWWALVGLEGEDETESFVCRRCRLDIGLGLREVR